MLSHEVAQKRLKAFQVKNWEKQRLTAIQKLPPVLRQVGFMLFGRDSNGKNFSDWRKRSAALEEVKRKLDELSEKERMRLFSTLFPKLARHVEGVWHLFQMLPYEIDYDRKGFRAPNDPVAHRDARLSWLSSLVNCLRGYDPDVVWCATWASYLSGAYSGSEFGLLLAAAINAGGSEGDEVFQILRESATNEHEISGMGRHVVLALLAASRSEGWEFIERLLLAAQRQEGLRQVILEAIDLTHPEAFKRMVRLMLEQNLLRFSSAVRAVDTWFGLQWSALTPAVLKRSLELVLRLLEDPAEREETLKSDKGEPLYLALWSIGFSDVEAAIPVAARLLDDDSVERRYIGVRFLSDLQLPSAREELRRALGDADLRVAVTALNACTSGDDEADKPDLWNEILALLARMPKKSEESEALVWPWATVSLDRGSVAGELINYRGKRPVTDLIPYLHEFRSYDRGELISELGQQKQWDAATRDLLFNMVSDRDGWVRTKALEALKKCSVNEADAQRIEAALTRKGSELRRGVLTLLRKQALPQVLASADRLLASKKVPQRQGGLELLQMLVEKKKAVAESRQRALLYQTTYPKLTEEEELLLENILNVQREKPSLKNALGLIDPAGRTPALAPVSRKVVLCTKEAVAILRSLDELVHKHRREPVTLAGGHYGDREEILENLRWGLPDPDPKKPAEADAQARLPLCAIWEEWYKPRPGKTGEKYGLELLRALAWLRVSNFPFKGMQKQFGKTWTGWMKLLAGEQSPVKLKYPNLVASVLEWMIRLHPTAGAVDYLLDVVETGYAHVPAEELKRVVKLDDWQKRRRDWRMHSPIEPWTNLLNEYTNLHPEAMTTAHRERLWQLQHWRDEPVPGVSRVRPELDCLLAGFAAGLANETDVIEHLIGVGQEDFSDLREVSDPGSKTVKQCPTLGPIVARIRERILEIELKRGEMPTAATRPAKMLQALPGSETLFRLLEAIGKKAFARETWGEGRMETLSGLVRATYPTAEDTPEQFAAEVKRLGLTRERLLELGFLAPAWLDLIEGVIGWSGLKEGVWWYLAHMPSGHPGIRLHQEEEDEEYVEEEEGATRTEPLNPWEKLLAERTRLTSQERQAGAVDPSWFHRVMGVLGRKRWEALGIAAKYGCTGAAQKKAIRLSEVLLGRAKRTQLIADIRDRNLKESVRLLGLLPLPSGAKRENELLTRYKVLIEYRRYARSLGPMSREDAVRTAEIGLENLASTAGYPDPIRLEWAMEARQIADLAEGPVTVSHDGVSVTLSITAEAQPELSVRRGEKPLKNVPGPVRKHRKVAALLDRRNDLKRQASRVKQSLEAMMVRGDIFSGHELRQLMLHPLLRPLLERLVILGEGIRGYPVAGGQALEDHTGKREPVKQDEKLRLAHPHDLFKEGDWDQWQAHCFRTEKVQPFKQVFRELYVLTKQEKEDGALSHRYAGQQVNPNQAMALWGSRGWRTSDEIAKTFHDQGIVAEVYFRHHGWTGAQVEGLTLEAISFRKVGEYKPLPLKEVPPRLFSEVMRDGDLVVSVAHVGGVDPEASASTVQMREALVRETCALLHIDNFKIAKSHVLIDGTLGKYSIHLGSGVVHRQPGGHLCIVPVHSQHRGRLFLPFADDDPRTAEVISKVLLLARDNEILDPSILEQLRS